MKTSESIVNIAKDLHIAQQSIGAAKKDAANPFFKSRFADLGSVIEACKTALLENEISVMQLVGRDELGEYLETVLLHSTGEYIADKMPLHPIRKMIMAKNGEFQPYLENDPQMQGSAITYARRYALQSMLFIPSEDDDAEGAQGRQQQQALPQRPPQGKGRPPRGEPEELHRPPEDDGIPGLAPQNGGARNEGPDLDF